MIMQFVLVFIGFIFFGFAANAAPAALRDCVSPVAELSIGACSKIIEDAAVDSKVHALAYTNRGNAYLRLKAYDRALSDYEMAIVLNPDFATPYNNRGIVYHRLGQYRRAITEFNKAVQLKPDYANAFNNRGYAYQQLGEFGKARSDYEKALEIDPLHRSANSNLKLLTANEVPI
jgi:tetratricopeptide (TPR) repeat protein